MFDGDAVLRRERVVSTRAVVERVLHRTRRVVHRRCAMLRPNGMRGRNVRVPHAGIRVRGERRLLLGLALSERRVRERRHVRDGRLVVHADLAVLHWHDVREQRVHAPLLCGVGSELRHWLSVLRGTHVQRLRWMRGAGKLRCDRRGVHVERTVLLGLLFRHVLLEARWPGG